MGNASFTVTIEKGLLARQMADIAWSLLERS